MMCPRGLRQTNSVGEKETVSARADPGGGKERVVADPMLLDFLATERSRSLI